MEDRDTFVGGSSTNSSRYNQNERAKQSGDNDADRITEIDSEAADQTKNSYFGTESKKDKSSEQRGDLREQQEGSLKNSK